jgi:peptidoglycan/xylan/chitin deacetylase (PgdA/CDA1 family)
MKDDYRSTLARGLPKGRILPGTPGGPDMKGSKRDVLAACGRNLGFTGLLGLLPTKPGLLVLNYHRIGVREDCPYDSGVFSATAGEFDEHIRFLKRRFTVGRLDEAIEIVEQAKKPRGTVVLLTFDDGYLDNYEIAFPVLSSHGIQGVFFLPTSFIGTNRIPWWDLIAAIIKRSRKSSFRLSYPSIHQFDIARDGALAVVEKVLWVFKREAVEDTECFLAALEEACDSPRPDKSERCFLNWEEAAAMLRGRMAVGSHTHSHEILSRLSEERQLEELVLSKRILEDRLGEPIRAMSYPVGLPESFSSTTRDAAQKAGYRAAFSFYGGCNKYGGTERYDVRRYAVDPAAARFQLQTTLAATTGKYWF